MLKSEAQPIADSEPTAPFFAPGLMGFVLSTILIVIFGEIIPQATCARYGLQIGYYTLPLTQFIMFCVAVLAYPISLCLDYMLGTEEGQLWSRAEVPSTHMCVRLSIDSGAVLARYVPGSMHLSFYLCCVFSHPSIHPTNPPCVHPSLGR